MDKKLESENMQKQQFSTGWLKIKYPTGEYAISQQPVV